MILLLLTSPFLNALRSCHRAGRWHALPNLNARPSPIDESIHLFSLQHPEALDTFNKDLMDIWRWKDAVLGNGRDYFVPKPKTLGKLQTVLLEQIPVLQECVILSNCARFEFLCVVNTSSDFEDPTDLQRELQKSLSQALNDQLTHHEGTHNRLEQGLLDALDRPTLIGDMHQLQSHSTYADNAKSLLPWNAISGVASVCRHLSMVATGMAPRPKRPNRSVEFRPYSSRDAHILLQLKRTVESTRHATCKQVLQAALSAGKASRNEAIVPEIHALKPSSFATSYSSANEKVARDACIIKAIEPAIQNCIDQLLALEKATVIQQFRETVLSWADTEKEIVWLKREMHDPTMVLRTQTNVDVDYVLQSIRDKLNDQRVIDAVVVSS